MVEKIASVAVVCTMVVVENLPYEVVDAVFVLCGDLLPSRNIDHMFFPKVDRMPDSLYPHSQLSDIMNSINYQALTPSFSYSYIPHVDVHKLGICDTKAHHCYSTVLGLQITNSF